MALGKIKADTLEHSTAGSLDTQYVVQGSAKAWVTFDGTGTPTARDSLNASSITDLSTGAYTHNWSNAFSSSSNVSAVGGGGQFSGAVANNVYVFYKNVLAGSITSQLQQVSSDTNVDQTFVNTLHHGDLA